MSAGQLDLLIEAGATFEVLLTWEDPDGDPIDVTGFDARMQVRNNTGTLLLDLTSDPAAGLTLGGAAGTIAIRVGADDTDELDAGVAYYDLELVSQSDATEVVRLVEGSVTINAQVTV